MRRTWRRVRVAGDEGFSTLVVLALGMVLCVLGAAVGAAGTVTAARHRAEAVADLAALAAAAHAGEGQTAACRAARRLAEEQGAVLEACRLEGLDAVVTAGVAPPGRLASFGLLHGVARAGRR